MSAANKCSHCVIAGSVPAIPGEAGGASIGGGVTSTWSIGTYYLNVLFPYEARRKIIIVLSLTCSALWGPVAAGASFVFLAGGGARLVNTKEYMFAFGQILLLSS